MRHYKKNKICKINKIYKPRYKRRRTAFIGSVEQLCEYYDDIDRYNNKFKRYPMVHKGDMKEEKIVIPDVINNMIINEILSPSEEEIDKLSSSSEEDFDKLSLSSDEDDTELSNLLSTVDEQKLEEIISSMNDGHKLQGLLPTIIEADNEEYDVIDTDEKKE